MALEQHHKTSSEDKIPIGQKIGNGIGGMATQVAINSTTNLFLLIYNAGLGVNSILLGLAQFLPRLLDAFIDPLIGNTSDNTRSRFGRRIPYVFFGGILLGITFALLWMVPKAWSEYQKFGYFLIASLVFFVAASVFDIPRGALALEMSNDYHERTSLFTYYSFIVNLGAALMGSWLYWFANLRIFKDEVVGMKYVGVGIGVVFAVSGIICAILCKEKRIQQVSKQEYVKFWDGVLTTSKNRNFLRLLLVICLVTVGSNFVVGFSSYIMVYYLFSGDKSAASVLMGWSSTFWALLSLISVIPVPWLARRWGKARTVMTFLLIMSAGNLLKIFCYSKAYPWLILIPTAALAMGWLVLFTLGFSMLADICDEDELKTSKRREGSYQAMFWYWFKVGVALAMLAAGFLLNSTGFNKDLTIQSDSTLFWLRFWDISLPSVVCLIGALLLVKYPLTEEKAYEIKAILAERKLAAAAERSADLKQIVAAG